ncbi:MAG: hypothetical protein AAGC65_12760 [Mucilaginibacter sp.]|uniref:hypothetical protein n=1 Tax=Mucilaginibacter sp. TaxID=1882438 RepID=UPI0031A9116A
MKVQPSRKIWGIPVLLGLITLFGLLSALLGTGVWWVLAWGAMVIPLIVVMVKTRIWKAFQKG